MGILVTLFLVSGLLLIIGSQIPILLDTHGLNPCSNGCTLSPKSPTVSKSINFVSYAWSKGITLTLSVTATYPVTLQLAYQNITSNSNQNSSSYSNISSYVTYSPATFIETSVSIPWYAIWHVETINSVNLTNRFSLSINPYLQPTHLVFLYPGVVALLASGVLVMKPLLHPGGGKKADAGLGSHS